VVLRAVRQRAAISNNSVTRGCSKAASLFSEVFLVDTTSLGFSTRLLGRSGEEATQASGGDGGSSFLLLKLVFSAQEQSQMCRKSYTEIYESYI
jgi:hypothetical protein